MAEAPGVSMADRRLNATLDASFRGYAASVNAQERSLAALDGEVELLDVDLVESELPAPPLPSPPPSAPALKLATCSRRRAVRRPRGRREHTAPVRGDLPCCRVRLALDGADRDRPEHEDAETGRRGVLGREVPPPVRGEGNL